MIYSSPIKIQGKKTKIIPHIIEEVSKIVDGGEIDVICEPFAGSGIVGMNLARTFREQKILMVDSCEDLVYFFNFLRQYNDDPNVLAHRIVQFFEMNKFLIRQDKKNYTIIRKYFNENKELLGDLLPICFLFLNRMSYNGVLRYNNKGEFNTPVGTYFNTAVENSIDIAQDAISAMVSLKSTQANYWKGDAIDAINHYSENKEKILFYCDPPYLHRNTRYTGDWKQEDQDLLRTALLSSSSPFVVSSWENDAGENAAELSKWVGCKIVLVEHQYIVGPKKENRPKIQEVLIVRDCK